MLPKIVITRRVPLGNGKRQRRRVEVDTAEVIPGDNITTIITYHELPLNLHLCKGRSPLLLERQPGASYIVHRNTDPAEFPFRFRERLEVRGRIRFRNPDLPKA